MLAASSPAGRVGEICRITFSRTAGGTELGMRAATTLFSIAFDIASPNAPPMERRQLRNPVTTARSAAGAPACAATRAVRQQREPSALALTRHCGGCALTRLENQANAESLNEKVPNDPGCWYSAIERRLQPGANEPDGETYPDLRENRLCARGEKAGAE